MGPREVAILGPLVILTGFVLFPGVTSGPVPPVAICANNLRQIGLALESYRRDHGRYPPACIYDKAGKPMHSWRVLIFPHLDLETMFRMYDFNEPWNGPKNSILGPACPVIFHCPEDDAGRTRTEATSYVAVTGAGTAWASPSNDGKTKGRKKILVAEIFGSDVHWMEPRDVTREDLVRALIPESGKGPRRAHKRGVNVLVSSGRADDRLWVETLTPDTSEETLRRLLSP